MASLRHTCEIIMLSNQHIDMPQLWGGWIISAKEKCSLTDLWTILERNRPFFMYIEKVFDLWVQLMKNGGKNKSVAFIICFSVYILDLSHIFWLCKLTGCTNSKMSVSSRSNSPSLVQIDLWFVFQHVTHMKIIFWKTTRDPRSVLRMDRF